MYALESEGPGLEALSVSVLFDVLSPSASWSAELEVLVTVSEVNRDWESYVNAVLVEVDAGYPMFTTFESAL